MDSNTQQKRDELVARLRKANDIASANAVLSWDQSTYMPPAGASARARQMATLEGLAHEAATDPAIGRLLDELQPYADSLPPDDDDAALVRVARRSYERRTKVPAEFAAAFAGHTAETFSLVGPRPDRRMTSAACSPPWRRRWIWPAVCPTSSPATSILPIH